MQAVTKIKNYMCNIERALGISCSVAMMLCLILQTITRYVFGKPMTWTEELSVIFFIWSIYFGSVVAVSRGQHLRVELLISSLKPAAQLVMTIFSNTVFSAVMIYLTFGINGIIKNLAKFNALTAILRIPKEYIYIALPVCFVLLAVHLTIDSLEKIAELRALRANTAEGGN